MKLLTAIRSHRRILLLGGIAVMGLLSTVPSLPQGAFAVEVVRDSQRVQALATSPAPIAIPRRDGFAISAFSVIQWPVPVSTPISSGFGLRDCDGCSTDHTGTDVNPASGFPVRAISSGVVTDAGWDSSGYGNRVVVRHLIDGHIVSSL